VIYGRPPPPVVTRAASKFIPASVVNGAKAFHRFNAGPVLKTLGALEGGVAGHELGSNPLTVEWFMDTFNMSAEDAEKLTSKLYTGVYGGAGMRIPIIGPLVAGVANATGARALAQISHLGGSVAQRGELADTMARWYHGAKSGDLGHRDALREALSQIDSSPGLTRSIAGATPDPVTWASFAKRMALPGGVNAIRDANARYWSSLDDNQGSPALQSLIAKSRELVR
jgi:hypothetical protein